MNTMSTIHPPLRINAYLHRNARGIFVLLIKHCAQWTIHYVVTVALDLRLCICCVRTSQHNCQRRSIFGRLSQGCRAARVKFTRIPCSGHWQHESDRVACVSACSDRAWALSCMQSCVVCMSAHSVSIASPLLWLYRVMYLSRSTLGCGVHIADVQGKQIATRRKT